MPPIPAPLPAPPCPWVHLSASDFAGPVFSRAPLPEAPRCDFSAFSLRRPQRWHRGDGPAATSRGAARLPASATFPALTILLRTARFPRNGPPALPQRGRPWSSAIKRKTRLPIFRIEERLLFAPQLPVCGNGSGAAGPRPFFQCSGGGFHRRLRLCCSVQIALSRRKAAFQASVFSPTNSRWFVIPKNSGFSQI